MPVEVSPQSFTMVDYDAARIATFAEELATRVGLPEDHLIQLEIDERTPLARVDTVSLDPLRITIESGALENPKRIRQLSDDRMADVLGIAFMQALDRLDPEFGGPPVDERPSLPHTVAWDAYATARMERLGLPSQRRRRQYHFRNRHGFTDRADEAFDRIWSAERLTWAELTRLSDEAAAAAA